MPAIAKTWKALLILPLAFTSPPLGRHPPLSSRNYQGNSQNSSSPYGIGKEERAFEECFKQGEVTCGKMLLASIAVAGEVSRGLRFAPMKTRVLLLDQEG